MHPTDIQLLSEMTQALMSFRSGGANIGDLADRLLTLRDRLEFRDRDWEHKLTQHIATLDSGSTYIPTNDEQARTAKAGTNSAVGVAGEIPFRPAPVAVFDDEAGIGGQDKIARLVAPSRTTKGAVWRVFFQSSAASSLSVRDATDPLLPQPTDSPKTFVRTSCCWLLGRAVPSSQERTKADAIPIFAAI